MTTLNKCMAWTDWHWGCKNNSDQHLQDCIDYGNWLIEEIEKDPEIDHLMFLGDFFDNRSAINIKTLTNAYDMMVKINNIGLPVYFLVGNHDLYNRHTRDIHSVEIFSQLSNFNIINDITYVKHIGSGVLMCPFLLDDEYNDTIEHSDAETWWGHFEFKGFVVSGANLKMPSGPNPADFTGPKHIFSGHFHKRQADGNIVYIGNTFPLSFADANDRARGAMKYTHDTDDTEFIDWPDCPKYIKTKLSSLIDDSVTMYPEARVKCLVDIPISFEESTIIKDKFTKDYKLRELSLEESSEIQEVLESTHVESTIKEDKLSSVHELIQTMLSGIESKHLNNDTLIDIYKSL